MRQSTARTVSAWALSALLVASPVMLGGCSWPNRQAVSSTEQAQLNNGASSNANGTNSNTQNTLIGEDAALDVALSDAGLTADQVTVTKCVLTTDDGVDVYEVDFTTSNSEHDYEIDATSGQILQKDNETYTATSTGATTSQNAASTSVAPSTGVISQDAAKAIAAENAGFSVDKVTFTEVKLDTDDGVQEYDVTFRVNGVEHECTINAITGAVISHEQDRD